MTQPLNTGDGPVRWRSDVRKPRWRTVLVRLRMSERSGDCVRTIKAERGEIIADASFLGGYSALDDRVEFLLERVSEDDDDIDMKLRFSFAPPSRDVRLVKTVHNDSGELIHVSQVE